MRILLPPSESKRPGGGGVPDPTRLAFAAQLGPSRDRVRGALEALCRDEDEAARVLRLGPRARGELAGNRALASSGVLPAAERYSGVLYEELDARGLDSAARRWLGDHVLVQSALFGLIGAMDPIPPYRLSAGSRLPALGASLATVWRAAHHGWLAAGEPALPRARLVLDLRSADVAKLAPAPGAWPLHVVQRGVDGTLRALSHFNKQAKGDFVRRLARAGGEMRDAPSVVDWARGEGLEVRLDADRLTLVTALGAPGSSGGALAPLGSRAHRAAR